MNILEQIATVKKEEVRERKLTTPVSVLEKSVFFSRRIPSFYETLSKPQPSVIGEFKRKSPSKGNINLQADVSKVTSGYQRAGISAVSVLTDEQFFGGNSDDLRRAAELLDIPILRKDFIVDEYQIIEARSIGASAILLIASILTRQQIDTYAGQAHDLGMDVLFEIHDAGDIEKISDKIRIIGINNRDLRTFDVSLSNSDKLFSDLPAGCIKVAESGLKSPADTKKLFDLGFDAFLIGEYFMKSEDPGKMAAQFMSELNSLLR